MKKTLLLLIAFLYFTNVASQNTLVVERKLNHFWVDTLYSQIDFSFTNKSSNHYVLWIERNDVSSLSESEIITNHFFRARDGGFSLMQIIWDGNVGRFTPGLFEGFMKIIKPNERFVVSIIVKGREHEDSDKINSLKRQIQFVDVRRVRGLENSLFLAIRQFSYSANNITILYEWFDKAQKATP